MNIFIPNKLPGQLAFNKHKEEDDKNRQHHVNNSSATTTKQLYNIPLTIKIKTRTKGRA